MSKNEDLKLNLVQDIKEILSKLGNGDISPSAYDTAWVARIASKEDYAKPMFPECLQWVEDNQLPDGSWGAPDIEYYHDRVICTLSSIVALKVWDINIDQIRKGEKYINNNLSNLQKDSTETIGFELVFTSLIEKAKSLEISLNYDDDAIKFNQQLREKKLQKLPIETIYKFKSTVSHSIEFLDGIDIDLERIFLQQETNGSFGNSPAATSFILTKISNEKAEEYIKNVLAVFGDFVPSIYPFEIFEKAWILDNILEAEVNLASEEKEILEYLYKNWSDVVGSSISYSFPHTDLDDSGMVFSLLNKKGYSVNKDVFNFYKREDIYVCFPFQLNPSVSAYVHFFAAILTLKEKNQALIDHILSFFKDTQNQEGYWMDKWQISPYYTTGHLVRELINNGEHEMLDKAIKWLIKSQRADGSWGFLDKSTEEESAYALQALIHYHKKVNEEYKVNIERGIEFLKSQNIVDKKEFIELWIDKGLYSPNTLIKILVLSVIFTYLSF